MEFDVNQIDRQQLKKLNLIDNKGNILLNRENIEFLKSGKQTDDIDLKGVKLRDREVDLKASLSLYKDKGNIKLRIHPYYQELERNQLLSDQERKYISEKAGVHSKHTHVSGEVIEHGEAKYKFDEKQQNSYFVKLKTASGETATVWGVNLQKGMSGKTPGEKVTIKYVGQEAVQIKVPTIENGQQILKPMTTYRNDFSIKPYNEKNDYRNSRILIEFNKDKNSFDITNTNRIPKVQAINGEKLSKEQQEQLERGEEITTRDGNKVKYSPQKQTFVQANNKRLLIASLLLDGGLSYLIIKAVDHFANKEQNKAQAQENIGEQNKAGVDKEYIKELEKLKNEIDNKIRKTDDKKELTEIKEYINKEIDKVSVTPYQEQDLEQRREDTVSNQVDEKEEQTMSPEERKEVINEIQTENEMEDWARASEEQVTDLPFEEDMEISQEEEIKHNDMLDDWERTEIERQEMEFNEQEEESQSQDVGDDADTGGDEEEDEEQERSRGRGR